MAAFSKALRYLLIVVAIAICPTWPDLMGHAAVMVPAADAVGAALGVATASVFDNAHFVLLTGMVLGGLLLTVAPRIITDRLVPTVALAGIAGSISIVTYASAVPAVSGVSIVVSAVCFIVLYGSTFYLLAGTAGYIAIATISAFALALKAAILPVVESMPSAVAMACIVALPLVCSGCALLYRRMSSGICGPQDGALDPKSYGRRTSVFMAALIVVSSIVFAVMRASSDKSLWGSPDPILVMSPALVLVCTVTFLVLCYATFVSAPRDLMLRFLPCLAIQLVAYWFLWCGGLQECGISYGSVGDTVFCNYTELYSHMYFFMVMFVGLSMLGTQGVRVHGIQWMVFSSALFIILALGWTQPTVERFIVVLMLDAALAVMFFVGHGVYEQDQIRAIKAASEKNAHAAIAAAASLQESVRCPLDAPGSDPALGLDKTALVAGAHCGVCDLYRATENGDDPIDGSSSVHSASEARTGNPTDGGPGTEQTPRTLETVLHEVSAKYALSDREQEVLALLIQGRTRQYIGEQLYLASGTVGSYISRIYEKMRVHSKQELLTIVYDEVANAPN